MRLDYTMSTYIFLNNSVKNQPILIIVGIQNLEETSHKHLQNCPPHLKMSSHYLVKSKITIFNNKSSLGFVAANEQGSEMTQFGLILHQLEIATL